MEPSSQALQASWLLWTLHPRRSADRPRYSFGCSSFIRGCMLNMAQFPSSNHTGTNLRSIRTPPLPFVSWAEGCLPAMIVLSTWLIGKKYCWQFTHSSGFYPFVHVWTTCHEALNGHTWQVFMDARRQNCESGIRLFVILTQMATRLASHSLPDPHQSTLVLNPL